MFEFEDKENGDPDQESLVSFGRLGGEGNAATPGSSGPANTPKPENPKAPKVERKKCGLRKTTQPLDD